VRGGDLGRRRRRQIASWVTEVPCRTARPTVWPARAESASKTKIWRVFTGADTAVVDAVIGAWLAHPPGPTPTRNGYVSPRDRPPWQPYTRCPRRSRQDTIWRGSRACLLRSPVRPRRRGSEDKGLGLAHRPRRFVAVSYRPSPCGARGAPAGGSRDQSCCRNSGYVCGLLFWHAWGGYIYIVAKTGTTTGLRDLAELVRAFFRPKG
jgi:hypothetical protein